MSSVSASTAQDSAAELYLGFFGRAPDTAGFIYWADKISNGTSILAVAQEFSQSSEFLAQYGNISHYDQVNQIYQHVLNRAPDPGGWEYWTNLLDTGSSIGKVVWEVVDAAFHGGGTNDAALVQSQIQTAEARMAPIANNTATVTWSVAGGFGQADVSQALSAVIDKSVTLSSSSPISLQAMQWDIAAMHFQAAWSAGFAGKGVVIAEIDTGIDLGNAALTQNLSAYNWNFINNSPDVQDNNGHGTIVASELVANAVGGKSAVILGGAYDAQLMVLKVADANGAATDVNLISAINYAVAHGANVINISLGGNNLSSMQLDAITNAANQGVIVCMAAGNSSGTSPQYPAAFASSLSTAIAVGASAQTNLGAYTFASFSNQAGSVAPFNYVDAPGNNILAYGLNNVLQNSSGTSIACPLISAEAAILLSAHSGLTSTQIVQAIVHDTVPLVGIQSTTT